MRLCSPLMELMYGTLPPSLMAASTPACRAAGLAESIMSCVSVTLRTVAIEPEQVVDLVAAGDAAVDVEDVGAGRDLLGRQGLDELGVARLDGLADLLASPVDRFAYQQHDHYLHYDVTRDRPGNFGFLMPGSRILQSARRACQPSGRRGGGP